MLVAAIAGPGGPTEDALAREAPAVGRIERADSATSLAGTWRFRVGDDPDWAAPDLDDRDWWQIRVPGPWGRQGYRNLSGFAWYRTELALAGEALAAARAGRLGLRFGNVDSSYALYVGGKRVGGVGGLPPQADPMYDRHGIFALPTSAVGSDGRLTIALRVWRSPVTRGFQGGITNGPVEIGPVDALRHAERRLELPDVGLAALFGLAGLYHLVVFWRRRTLREYLWFGVTAFLFASYTFLRTQARFSLSDDFVLLKNLEYLALYLIPVAAIQFFYELFSRKVPWIFQAVQVASAVMAAIAVVTPTLDFNIATLTTWQYAMVMILAGTVVLVVTELRRGHPEAPILVVSFSLLGLAVLNDVLRDQAIIQTARLVPYGFATFVVMMAIVLAGRLPRARPGLGT